jgi:NAD(P)-dependent dehydrogenase (short-subunit alcohol dehydrogenase family)
MVSKNVLITGGGSGAGLGMLRSFALAGAAHVGIIGRRLSVLEATATASPQNFQRQRSIRIQQI